MATQRPAIIVWRWYGHGKDVCTVITDTNEVRFVARDVMLALDQPLDHAFENEPDHTILADHANCITWSWEQSKSVINALDTELAAQLLGFLRHSMSEFERWTAEALAEAAKPKPAVDPVTAKPVPVLPEYYSVAAAAKILDRDPAITTGQRALFEHLHKSGWITRSSRAWVPNQDAVYMGWLTEVVRDVPGNPEYPQVCITPKGIYALHNALGGVAAVNLQPRDHLALVQE